MIRHRIDGRALDVNFGRLKAGTGVNLTVPYKGGANEWLVVPLVADPLVADGEENVVLEEAGIGLEEVL